MNALYQRLKELDPVTFQRFFFHLLKEMYPNSDIRQVDGTAGDDGIDLFLGDLDVGPVVWQCKAFSNGVGKSQREKIRESFRRAMDTVSPKLWVLCISIDLSAEGHRWWQRFQRSYQQNVSLSLIDASEIVHQLIYRRTLREVFFPQAVMDIALLRSSLAGKQDISTEDLAALSSDNVALFLDRLNDKDPRFSYEVSFRHNTGPASNEARSSLLRVTDDQKTINVFARDPATLRLRPPTMRFSLQGPGVERIQELLQTGKPQELRPGELSSFASDFDFLFPVDVDPVSTWQLSVRQSPEHLPKYSFRITVGDGPAAKIWELVRFQVVRLGKQEVELQSTSPLPFKIHLVIQFAGTLSISWTDNLAGFRVAEVSRALNMLAEMSDGGSMELYDLEAGKRFLKTQAKVQSPEWLPALRRVADDAAVVTGFYGVDLRWPASITPLEAETLHRLKGLIDGLSVAMTNASFALTKLVQLPRSTIQEHLKRPSMSFPYQSAGAINVFGTLVTPGPLEITIDQYRIINKRDYSAFLSHAPLGAQITVHVETQGWAIVRAAARSVSGRQ